MQQRCYAIRLLLLLPLLCLSVSLPCRLTSPHLTSPHLTFPHLTFPHPAIKLPNPLRCFPYLNFPVPTLDSRLTHSFVIHSRQSLSTTHPHSTNPTLLDPTSTTQPLNSIASLTTTTRRQSLHT